MVVSEPGATTDLARLRWLEHHTRLLERKGYPRVPTYPPSARFRFGDGRLGEVRHATDMSECTTRSKGKFAKFALYAEIPAFSRKGVSEAPGGQLGCPRNMLTLRKQGVNIPAKVGRMGHYVLRVIDFGERPA